MTDSLDFDALRARLRDGIKRNGLSMRAVSLSSGNGAGYVHSIVSEGKVPTVTNLAKICDAANLSLLYVMYGLDVSPETEAIIRRIEANPEKRDGILSLLKD